jgi:hypothetical protein
MNVHSAEGFDTGRYDTPHFLRRVLVSGVWRKDYEASFRLIAVFPPNAALYMQPLNIPAEGAHRYCVSCTVVSPTTTITPKSKNVCRHRRFEISK